MVETWQPEPGGLPTKMKPMMMETQAEPKSPGDTEGPGDPVEARGTRSQGEARVPED